MMEEWNVGMLEVAWAKGLMSTVYALEDVPGARDQRVAGEGLLGLLGQLVASISESALRVLARQAMQIAQEAALGDDVYYEFDRIEDDLALTLPEAGAYGTVEECRAELLAALAGYQALDVYRQGV